MKLYIVTYDDINRSRGIGTYVKNTVECLKNNYDISVIFLADENITEEKDGVKYVGFKKSRNKFKKIIYFQKSVLRYFLKKNDLKNCIINFQETTGFACFKNKEFKESIFKTVTTFHHSHLDELKSILRAFFISPLFVVKNLLLYISYLEQKFCCKRSDFVITVSWASKKIIEKFGVNKNKILVVPNTYKSQNNILEKKEKSFNKKYIYIGGIEVRKGVDLAIKAFNKIKNNGDIFNIIGSGSFERGLIKYIKDNNLEDSVKLHGYISDSEKVNLLKKSDVFIFPTFCEAFGIVVLEAMENGLNIIASDLPVFKEIFGSSIEYFEKGNCIDLAKKMQLKNIGDQSKYKNILEKYSYENFYIKCKQVFNVINNEGENN